jgi:hypothetical protein
MERFPKIKLIVNSENVGFAAGNNIGAREACGDYLLLLNNDTLLLSDVEPALRLIENRPEIGVVGARMCGLQRLPAPAGIRHSLYAGAEWHRGAVLPQLERGVCLAPSLSFLC